MERALVFVLDSSADMAGREMGEVRDLYQTVR